MHISSPTHACMQCIRAPPTLVCRPVRWLELSGKRRMVILYELTVLRRLQTNMCSPWSTRCGDTQQTQASAWSRAVTTAWSRAYCISGLRAELRPEQIQNAVHAEIWYTWLSTTGEQLRREWRPIAFRVFVQEMVSHFFFMAANIKVGVGDARLCLLCYLWKYTDFWMNNDTKYNNYLFLFKMQIWMNELKLLLAEVISLEPGSFNLCGRKKEPGTHCLRMCRKFTWFGRMWRNNNYQC